MCDQEERNLNSSHEQTRRIFTKRIGSMQPPSPSFFLPPVELTLHPEEIWVRHMPAWISMTDQLLMRVSLCKKIDLHTHWNTGEVLTYQRWMRGILQNTEIAKFDRSGYAPLGIGRLVARLDAWKFAYGDLLRNYQAYMTSLGNTEIENLGHARFEDGCCICCSSTSIPMVVCGGGHAVHIECIIRWKLVCPTCKQPYDESCALTSKSCPSWYASATSDPPSSCQTKEPQHG